MNVLSWNYKYGTDETLDAIYRINSVSQVSLAEELGLSKRTVEARVSKLKKKGLLWICRSINKEIYYCIGEDAYMKWSAIDAKAVLSYRNDSEDIGLVATDIGDRYIYKSNINQTIYDNLELDMVVDNLVDELKSTSWR